MEPMKPIDDQLDEHFGVDCWHKAEGEVMEGDVFYTSGTIFKAIQIGLPATSGYYRVKPKLKPEQSEKFWMVMADDGERYLKTSLESAISSARDLADRKKKDFVVCEQLGIARAPKAVEYETL